MFKDDAKEGFLVMDAETKQRIRAHQSEALGREFQHQQIEEAKKSARPVVIVDSGVLVDYLWMVKKWLSHGKCFVVIAKEGQYVLFFDGIAALSSCVGQCCVKHVLTATPYDM